ncbi:MAG: tyrosine-type recombinase/integrase [Bdellovibrionaceae bacterium]|nr:tyrosine-type recombinase/integrase [Pseudobdellovibrionaceae bacterium]
MNRRQQARDLHIILAGIGLPHIRFHDLRATRATRLLSQGVAAIKVMRTGGWQKMEPKMIYARKAGVDINGRTGCLNLHDRKGRPKKALRMRLSSDL